MKNLVLKVLMIPMAVAGILRADEGMWLPHQMKDLKLKELGLLMDPGELYKTDGSGLMSAVVSLGGGTGEFVSASGLILTNHHVAFGAIQRASEKDHDYLANGFYASGPEQEIQALNMIADILLGYEEVTGTINAALKPGMSPRQRYQAIELASKKIVQKAEKKGKDLSCSVRAVYSGNQYFLFTFKRLKDIRLVYAPPSALGNFGGETDNWMWPRHTCDFTFLRAYVSKDGVGVPYAKDNVPYKPKSFLKISRAGVKAGDFTFIMGYPGRTYRNNTAAEMSLSLDNLKKRVQQNRELIRFFEEAGKKDRGIEIKYAGRMRGLYNSLKNSEGKIEGMARISLIQMVTRKERQFQVWAAQDPLRQKKYGKILGEIELFLAEYRDFTDRQEAASALTGQYAPALVGQAYQIYRLAVEKQKPDLERERGFQERDIPALLRRLETADRSFDMGVDREFFKYALRRIHEMYPGQVPPAIQKLLPVYSEKGAADLVDRIYDQTLLKDPKQRLKMAEMNLASLLKLKDPLIGLAAEMEKDQKANRDKAREMGQRLADLRKVYEAGLLEQGGGRLAPDANGTIRFTYGPVAGYAPRDAVLYLPQTTLTGVIEKDKGRDPFAVPGKLKTIFHLRDYGPWRDEALNDVPACFLNATNVTGGNSGSPVLNARGEQVGIIFDMTYESLTGDYYVIPELQRSVAVDIRYVLFLADKFTNARRILEELGFQN